MKFIDQISRLLGGSRNHSNSRRNSHRDHMRHLPIEQLESRCLLTTIDLAALTAAAGTTIFGADAGDFSGWSVSIAGDVNGDGFDDLLIGAFRADASGNAKSSAGESYVIFGGASLPATIDLSSLGSAGLTIFGADGTDFSGGSVSGAGDVNGDGFDDLLIGASGAAASGNAKGFAGESYVIFGGASLPSTIDLSSLGSAGLTIFGADAGDRSGVSVSGAGDVNGDGFDDLLIGAYVAAASGNAKSIAGESYVIFGGASLPATIDLSSLGSAGITIFGADIGDYSGVSVSGAGDVNGDGFDDLLIGARAAAASGNALLGAGDSYVIFGGASLPATIDLSSLGSAGLTIFGADAGDRSGISVSGAGDVNGDGFDDLLIGAFWADASGNAKSYAGDSYVIFGGASLPSTIDLAALTAAQGITIFGADGGDQSGFSVSSAGDVNGDGFDDLLIGAYVADASGNAKSAAGDSYVIFGGASLPSTIDLSSLGSAGITIFGADAGDRSGRSVSGAGDVNGDGFDDLLIGAIQADASGNAKDSAGESYVIFGGDFTATITQGGTAVGETLTGTASANVMIGGRGDDLLIGSGGADVLTGGEGSDVLAVSDLMFNRIVGGTGVDTLRLDGSGVILDLTAIRDNRIVDVEEIDITGSGANTLTLNVQEVLNISSHSNTLTVRRDIGDSVNIGTGWTQGADQLVNGVTYNTFTQGAATLLVQVVNDQPVADAVAINATEDGPAVNGSFSVTDPDTTDTHTFGVTSQPAEGAVTNNNDGTFTFNPGTDFQDLAAGETRNVSFQYTATDNSGAPNATSPPATVTVTVTGDLQNLVVDNNSDVVDGNYSAGNLSLREALQLTNANAGFSHTITFGNGSAAGGTNFLDTIPDTITLAGTELTISNDITITGTGAALLTINANQQSRIFNIDDQDAATEIVVNIDGLTLTGGDVTGSGGAIFTREALTVSNSTISGNSTDSGGGIRNEDGTLTVSNSTISGNTAVSFGGGIYNRFGTLTVSNSTISGNSADSGGGIQNGSGSTATVSNSTISGNSNSFGDGGGGIHNGTDSSATVSNSIVAGNTQTDGTASDFKGSGTVTGRFNLIGDAATSGGLADGSNNNIVGVDWTTVLENEGSIPTLADNGGPTQTIALRPGSPAINTGSNILATDDGTITGNPLTTDQRGTPNVRIFNGTVDIGAFEFQIAVNDDPTLDAIGNLTINEDASEQTVNLSGITAGGGESQPLRVTSTSSSTGLIPNPAVTYTTANATGSIAFTPVADQSGTATITVTVEDGGLDGDLSTAGDNATFSRTFDVTVNDDTIPTGFVVTAPIGRTTAKRPEISWRAVDGALSYDVWLNIDGGGGNVVRELNRPNTQMSYQVAVDLDFAVYRVFVYANMPGGTQETAAGHTFIVDEQAQLTPIGATTDTNPQFTWNRVSGAATYVLFVNLPGNPITATINDPGTGTTVNHTLATALPRNDYKWWVRPVRDNDWQGPWSVASEFSTGGRTKVTSPARNSTVTDSIPTFNWPPVPRAQRYEVYVAKAGTPGVLYRDPGITGNSIRARALEDGNYKVWIRTTQADGSGVWGSGVAFTVATATTSLQTTPSTPSSPGFNASPAFTWQSTTGATSYDVYLHHGTSSILETGRTGTTWTPSTALAGGEWTWSVRPVNSTGVGAWSAATAFTTNGLTKLLTPAANTSDTTPEFTWQPVTGAVTYEIQVDNRTTNTANVIREAGLTGTSFTSSTALTAGTYRAWVRAISSTTIIIGPWSVQFDFVVASGDVEDSSEPLQNLLASVRLLDDALVVTAKPAFAPTPTAAVDERDEASQTSAEQGPKPPGITKEMVELDEQFALAQEWLSIV
jgi:hypothetical protein